jgi:cyanophycinase
MYFYSQRAPIKNQALRRAAVGLLWSLALACGQGNAQAQPADTARIVNVVIGGAERRCSSFTGPVQGPECSADWDTILAQDAAFKGIARNLISFEADYPAPVFTYSLTAARTKAFAASPKSLFDAQRKAVLMHQLAQAAKTPQLRLTWQQVEVQLPLLTPAPNGAQSALTTSEVAVLRTALVDPNPQWHRKYQGRSIQFSTNPHSKGIALAFVAAARAANAGRQPLIGVVTASASPHPFVDRDINVFALKSAGAKVVYLPLDGGFREAMDTRDCANLRYYNASYTNTHPQQPHHHADLMFPDLARQQYQFCVKQGARLNATLGQINGIFFTGGNQARHLESLVSKEPSGNYQMRNQQINLLQRRHAAGLLAVGGTSAGAHIQGGGLWRGKPVPMIGGGDSFDALKQGFGTGRGPAGDEATAGQPEATTANGPVLYPQGGLGVFRYGVLDTHFSRRAREARLIRATHESGMDYGFGVDENTALLTRAVDAVGTTYFSVLGAAGVFIADVRQARVTSLPGQPYAIEKVKAHYLREGDTAFIDAAGDLQVALNPLGTAVPVVNVATATDSPVLQNAVLDYGASHFLQMATRMGQQGALTAFGSTQHSRDVRTQQSQLQFGVTLTRNPQTQFLSREPRPPQSLAGLSYVNLEVRIQPCATTCAAPAPDAPPATARQ